MKNIFTIIAFTLSFSITTTAQETSILPPRPCKQFGLRIHKEIIGTGLSGQLELPISKNGKWMLSNSLGITIAHPYYDLFTNPENRGSDWKNTTKPKWIDFRLNYPIGIMYNLHFRWYANTKKKWSSVLGFGYLLYLLEGASGMDTDNFYVKNWGLLYGITPSTSIGVVYRPSPKWKISLDANVSIVKAAAYKNNKWVAGGFGPLPSVGINILWNWR